VQALIRLIVSQASHNAIWTEIVDVKLHLAIFDLSFAQTTSYHALNAELRLVYIELFGTDIGLSTAKVAHDNSFRTLAALMSVIVDAFDH